MMMMMFEMEAEQEQEKKVPDGTKTYSSIKELENRFDNSQEKQCYKYASDQRMKSYGY
tara:strand:- start:169 stop:342 length:174 start_codon:yes stop_codon:yes gene_type:complete